MELRILAVGDVVGLPGLSYLSRHLRSLKQLYKIDFCVVNGENANGVGILPRQADLIFDAGADVITLGNHTFGRREICPYLDDNRYILRPANLAPSLPGHGWGVFETNAGPVAVANLIGRCAMDFTPDNPFRVVDKILKDVGTIPSLWEANMEVLDPEHSGIDLFDGRWKIYSRNSGMTGHTIGENAVVGEALSEGGKGVATVGAGVYIGDNAKIGPDAMVSENVKGGEEQW